MCVCVCVCVCLSVIIAQTLGQKVLYMHSPVQISRIVIRNRLHNIKVLSS